MPRKLWACQPAASPRQVAPGGGGAFSQMEVFWEEAVLAPLSTQGALGVHRCLRPASLELLTGREWSLGIHTAPGCGQEACREARRGRGGTRACMPPA